MSKQERKTEETLEEDRKMEIIGSTRFLNLIEITEERKCQQETDGTTEKSKEGKMDKSPTHIYPGALSLAQGNKLHSHNLYAALILTLCSTSAGNYVLFNKRNIKITIIFLMEVLRNLLPPYISISFYMK